jgi:magnesium chelatase family protein
MPEFQPQVLDALRQPLETGEVLVARANAHVRYPARVQLVAAQNPCRCGHGGAGKGWCGKAPKCQMDYQNRISGPLLDRIDLQVDVPPVTAADLALPAPVEGSAQIAARVAKAREAQIARADASGRPDQALNARIDGALLEKAATPDEGGRALMTRAAEGGMLSAREWTRVLRLARTIADLEGCDAVQRRHVAESLIYRRMPADGLRREEEIRTYVSG